MQRIFKYDDIQYVNLTPVKKLNILVYRTPSYVVIQELCTFKNGPVFLAHPVHLTAGARTSNAIHLLAYYYSHLFYHLIIIITNKTTALIGIFQV